MGKSLNEIQSDLRLAIRKMNEIISDMDQFQGIGQEVCVRKLYQFIDDCEIAIDRIEYVKQRRKEALVREAQERLRKLEEQKRLEQLENTNSGMC